MSIHRYQSTWRSITFNSHYDNTGKVDDPANFVSEATLLSRYQLDAVDVSKVSVQDYRELRQFLEGSEPNEAFEGVRAINGQGRIIATSAADLEDKAWALNEAFSIAACRAAAPALAPEVLPGVLPYQFRRANVAAGSVQLRFWARPGPGRPIWMGRRTEGLVRPFSFQLVAFDPFAYEEVQTQTTLANLAGGNNTVTNNGNVYTRPYIRITTSGFGAANFTIANTTTGATLVLDLTTLAANTFFVDTIRSAIHGSVITTNRYDKRVSGYASEQILVPGNNTIVVTNATNVTAVRFDFRGAFA